MTAIRTFAVVAVVAVAVVASSSCGVDDAVSHTDDTIPGVEATAADRLPDVEITALDDGTVTSLADVEGPAVVNLWATWCAPCRREIPDFEAVHRARGDEVRFVGINIGEDAADAREFLDEVGATYDQFLDPAGFVVTELQAAAMPVTVVVAPDGTIASRHLGPMDRDDLADAIDEALAG